MIISLFMDGTPLIGGSGNTLGARANVEQAGHAAGAQSRRHGDDQGDHEKHAEDCHVSAFPNRRDREVPPLLVQASRAIRRAAVIDLPFPQSIRGAGPRIR
jgi:hypothetical protein